MSERSWSRTAVAAFRVSKLTQGPSALSWSSAGNHNLPPRALGLAGARLIHVDGVGAGHPSDLVTVRCQELRGLRVHAECHGDERFSTDDLGPESSEINGLQDGQVQRFDVNREKVRATWRKMLGHDAIDRDQRYLHDPFDLDLASAFGDPPLGFVLGEGVPLHEGHAVIVRRALLGLTDAYIQHGVSRAFGFEFRYQVDVWLDKNSSASFLIE